MHASDRSEVFRDRSEVFRDRLQANDVTWPGVACVWKSMKLGMHSVWHVETKTEEVVFSRRS